MRLRFVIAILTIAVLLPGLARAFVRTEANDAGVDVAWPHRQMTWMLHQPTDGGDVASGVTYQAALGGLEAAFETWQNVSCTDLSFTFLGPTQRIDVKFDPSSSSNINLIVFRNGGYCETVVPSDDPCLGPMQLGVDVWPVRSPDSSANISACSDQYNCWEYGNVSTNDVFALTVVTYDTQDGTIVDADIELNASASGFGVTATSENLPTCTTVPSSDCIDADIQNTATHEIGHYLGLAHSLDPGATMFATANRGETSKRHLAPDDIDGICSIYPRWSPANGGQSCNVGSTSSMLPVLFLVLRRRRSRTIDWSA